MSKNLCNFNRKINDPLQVNAFASVRMFSTRVAAFFMLLVCTMTPVQAAVAIESDWMEGCWGIRIVLPSGNKDDAHRFDIDALTEQIAQLKSPCWVMLNLTQGAYGGYFTSPNSYVKSIDDSMVPKRNLLGEAIANIKALGLKVILYVATDGPAPSRLLEKEQELEGRVELVQEIQPIVASWQRAMLDTGLNSEELYAKIIAQYARKFENSIDGWWFDHGRNANPGNFIPRVKNSNPSTKVAWNHRHKTLGTFEREKDSESFKVWGISRSNEYEDYTAGHITPISMIEPWWSGNELIIEQIENETNGMGSYDGLRAHLFFPMQSKWRSGEAGFKDYTINNWTKRVIRSKGSITWAVALKAPQGRYPELESVQFEQLMTLDKAICAEFNCISAPNAPNRIVVNTR